MPQNATQNTTQDTTNAPKRSILVPLADGFEEMEFVSIVDILRRAGIDAVVVGIDGERLYKGAHGIEMLASHSLALMSTKETNALDGIALAGGAQGMQNLKSCPLIIDMLKDMHAKGKLISAICASPIVLDAAGVLGGEFACYPSCENGLKGSHNKKASVVAHDNLITSAAPATAPFFALEIVRYLLGEKKAQEIGEELLIPHLSANALIVRG